MYIRIATEREYDERSFLLFLPGLIRHTAYASKNFAARLTSKIYILFYFTLSNYLLFNLLLFHLS